MICLVLSLLTTKFNKCIGLPTFLLDLNTAHLKTSEEPSRAI